MVAVSRAFAAQRTMRCQRCALLVVASLALLWSRCMANIDLSFTGEFPEYTLQEEIVTVVLTVKAPPTVSPPPVSWTAVLDRSGSMRGRKVELLKDTTAFMIDTLATPEGSNSLGLVTYSSDVEALATVQPVFPSSVGFLTAIVDTIIAAGRTFLSGGLAEGLQQQAGAPGGKIKAVYLFTDGLPNIGATSIPDIANLVGGILEASPEPISISTFGFGNDLDIGLLQAISDIGGGDTYIIGTENDIPFAFGDALGLLLSRSAQEVEVVFTPLPGHEVVSVQSGGRITFLPNGSVRIVFDNLSAGEMRDILIEVRVPPVATAIPSQDIFTVENTYIDAPTMETITTDPIPYAIQRTPTTSTPPPPAPKVEETRIRFKAAEALSEAITKKEEGDIEGAKAVIAELVAETEESPLVQDPVIQDILTDVNTAQELLESDNSMEEEPQADVEVVQLERTFRTQRTTATGGRFRSTRALDTPFRRQVREQAAMSVLGPLPPPPPVAESPTNATDSQPPPTPVAEPPSSAPNTLTPPTPDAEPPAVAPSSSSTGADISPPPATPPPPPPATPPPPPPVTLPPPPPVTPPPPPPVPPSPPPPATPSPPPPLISTLGGFPRGRMSTSQGLAPVTATLAPPSPPVPTLTATLPVPTRDGLSEAAPPNPLAILEERREALRREAEAEAARRAGSDTTSTGAVDAEVETIGVETGEMAQPPLQAPSGMAGIVTSRRGRLFRK